MSFLAPAFLVGLAGLALPVLIHFLRRKKLQVIPWAAHRFLIASIKRNKQRIQFEDLLLLLVRCLLLALIVLVFARPLLNSERKPGATGGDAAQVVFLIDQSAGTGWSDGVSTRLDELRTLASRELDAIPAGTGVAVIAYSDRVQPVIARPTQDFALVRRELARLRPVGRGPDIAPALRAALDLVDALPRAPHRVIIFGDRQKLAWRDRGPIDLQVKRAVANGVPLSFQSPAGGDDVANLAVSSLATDTPDAVVGQPVRFFTEVFNGGTVPATQVRLTLSPYGGAPVAEKIIPALAPGARVQVGFTLTFDTPGFHAVTAAVPADALSFDDARTLALNVTSGVQVLVVEGPRPVRARTRPGFFLAEALAPVPPARRAAYPVQVQRIASSDFSPASLAGIGTVVLAGAPPLSPDVAAALDHFVRTGGGLWVFPAAGDPPADDPLAALLPDTAAPAGPDATLPTTPASPPYAHPVANLWNDPDNGTLTAVTIRHYLALSPRPAGAFSGAPEVVIKLADGSPLLVAASLGRGRILQSAIPGDNSWSDLPIFPVFVPLVQRGLAWLQGGAATPGAIAPGDAFVVNADPSLLGREFRVLSPGHSGAPVAAGRVELIGTQPSIRFTATSDPGLYQIFNDTDATPLAEFAVNPDPGASDLTPIDAATIATILRDTTAAPGSAAATRFHLPAWLTHDLWRILAGAALVLVLFELWLSQRFSRAK